MLQVLRHSLRSIAKSKATSAVVLLSLALGTGVNAAVYGVVAALLLRGPAGVGSPERLISIYTSEFSGATYGASSYPDFVSLASAASPVALLAAVDDNRFANLAIGEWVQSGRIAAVSPSFFDVLDMQPHAGRLFGAEGAVTAPAPAVVSFALADHHGGAAAVVGRELTVGSDAYVIVGVAPARFRGLQAGRDCDVWLPLTSPSPARGDRRLSIVGRLAPDRTLEDAAAILRAASDELAARFPATNRGTLAQVDGPRLFTGVRYSPLDPDTAAQAYLIGLVAGGASALLLASAILNVGSLLLSRGLSRRRELAVMMALGATRGRLVRQLLTEAVCLSAAGAALGLLFAWWAATAIPSLFMAAEAERLDTTLDARAMLLAVVLAGLAGALFGIAPALLGTGSHPSTALRADAGGVSAPQAGSRLRMLFVTGEIAVSAVLLLTASLIVASLSHALAGERMGAAMRVAFVSIELPGRFADPVRGVAYRRALLERSPAVSGVEAVGWASTLPLGRGNRRLFRIPGPTADVTDAVELDSNVVSSGYFEALSLVLAEGRLFDAGDTTLAPPVVVVDELLARRYFGPAALGAELVEADGRRSRIVGVVRGGRYRTLQEAPRPTVYYASTQEYLWRGHLVIRTSGDPATLLPGIRHAVSEVGDAAILRTSTLATHLSEVLPLDRLVTRLVGLCGLIALAMSAIGMYGVMSDSVQRRTREIGLRVALGAHRLQVARLVFREATYLAVGGLVIGAAAALALARLARHAVHDIASLDPLSLASVAAALGVVTGIAAAVPLGRALRVSPIVALRDG
jgi:predicted permease